MLWDSRRADCIEKFVQMVDHMKLVESERSINCTGQGILKWIFDRSVELLNFIFFVLCIIFPLVADGVVIADQSAGPILQNIAELNEEILDLFSAVLAFFIRKGLSNNGENGARSLFFFLLVVAHEHHFAF